MQMTKRSLMTIIKNKKILHQALLDTLLGPMIAIADDIALYLLEFANRTGLDNEIARLTQQTNAIIIISGKTQPINMIETELNAYFDGTLTEFKTPVCLLGSDFQKSVWHELQKIPMGHTKSYAQIAAAIGRPSACRAVARANSTNQLPIIIPCHRVINTNNKLGGYSGGVARKQWLIDHEKKRVL